MSSQSSAGGASPTGEMFGQDRLMASLERSAIGTAEATRNAITSDLLAFRAGVAQQDDMTLLVVTIV